MQNLILYGFHLCGPLKEERGAYNDFRHVNLSYAQLTAKVISDCTHYVVRVGGGGGGGWGGEVAVDLSPGDR